MYIYIYGLIVGRKAIVAATAARAYKQLRTLLEADGLKLQDKKLAFMANDPDVVVVAACVCPQFASAHTGNARNLGVDFTLGRRRLKAVVRAKRLLGARKRAMKIRKLRRAGCQIRRVVLQSLCPIRTYGVGITGATPEEVGNIR